MLPVRLKVCCTNGYAVIFPAINKNEIPVCFMTTNKQETFIVKYFFKAGTSFNVIQKAWIFGFSKSICKNAHDKNGYWFNGYCGTLTQSPTSTIKQPVSTRSCDVLSFVSKDLCFKKSRDIFSTLPPPLNLKLAASQSSLVSSTGSSGGCRGGAWEPRPLICRPNWSPKGRKFFFKDWSPFISGSGWPPPYLIWRSGSATGRQRER